jgi:hypothetical protein
MNTTPAAAAPQNTKCQPAGHACHSGKDAVHLVNGRPLCAFHSPYDVVEANGKTAGENYLARFDARQEAAQAQEQEAEEAPSSPALATKAAEEIEVGDVILTQYGWVVVTYWQHHFARAINLDTQWNEREITRVYVNNRYGFEAGAQVTVHVNPRGFTHQRFLASRRLTQGSWA